jgi:hypothetical protein
VELIVFLSGAREKWEMHTECCSECPKRRDHLEDLVVDVRIIFKWISGIR